MRPHGALHPPTMGAAIPLEPQRELTVDDLCALTGDPPRTVRDRVASWYERQHEPALPRVRRAREAGAARWCYLVDRATYDAWLAAEPAALPDALTPGSDGARTLGCRCVVMYLEGDDAGAYVSPKCPLHGALLRGRT